MKPAAGTLAAIVVVAMAAVVAWLVLRPSQDQAPMLSGYIEGDSLMLAAPTSGLVDQVWVAQGQRVQAGAPLFAMDVRTVGAQQAEAEAAASQERTQVAVAESAWRQAVATARAQEAVAANARSVADRYTRLRRADEGAVAAQELDKAVADAQAATAQLEALRRQAAAAQAQVATVRAGVRHADAGASRVGVQADLLASKAPVQGRIEEVYFQAGEWAGANQPVVSLLPDDRVKVRFYVPEGDVASYRIGRSVRFGCDGCGPERSAAITYVSARAEFTPPVIYSRENRRRLVFLVEARPVDASRLTPGLPVEVTPMGAAP